MATKQADKQTSVDQLIDKYRVTEESFNVTLPKGDVLKFKSLADYEEIMRINRVARDYARAHVSGRISPADKPFATKDEDIALCASLISQTSIDPKLTTTDLLRMKATWGTLFQQLVIDVVNRMQQISGVQEIEKMNELGEDSAQTV